MEIEGLKKIDEPHEYKLPDRSKIKSSNIVFFDEQGNVTDKEHAKSVVITEYDENGNLINETWGNVENERTKTL